MARIAGINSGIGVGLDNPGGGFESPTAFQSYQSPQAQVYNPSALLSSLQPKKDDDDYNPWDLLKGKKPDSAGGQPASSGGIGKSSGEGLKDALTIAQLVPGVGTFASLGQAGISASEGDVVGAATNLASAIPGVADILKAPKAANIAWKLGSKFGQLAHTGQEAGAAGNILGRIGGLFKR